MQKNISHNNFQIEQWESNVWVNAHCIEKLSGIK